MLIVSVLSTNVNTNWSYLRQLPSTTTRLLVNANLLKNTSCAKIFADVKGKRCKVLRRERRDLAFTTGAAKILLSRSRVMDAIFLSFLVLFFLSLR
jgi:hypothetical protein